MEFDYDHYTFEIDYTYEKGMAGDGWLQPDDPDEINIEKINMTSYITEDNHVIICKRNFDVKDIISNEILDAIEQAVWDNVEQNEYHL